MKAVQISTYGEIDIIQITPDAPKPTPSDEQVLVEVHAASLNPFDVKVRKGFMQQVKQLDFPVTLGGDLAGVVSAVGKNVSEVSVGDKVYGSANLFGGGSGAFAEFAVAKSVSVSKIPSELDFIEAAALPLTGTSAVQALEGHIKLEKGQKILIHGGSGGIGTMAIQLAKYLGAYVATTVSSKAIEYVKSLGADEVLDYKTQKFEEILSDYDAVFDTVGGETYDKSFQVLKKGGVIVSMVQTPNEEFAKKFGVTAIIQGTKISEWLESVTQLVNDGVIKPHVDSTFSIDQVQEAFRAQEEGHPQGKVVITIR